MLNVISGIEDLRDAQATLELAMKAVGDALAEERKLCSFVQQEDS